MHDLIAAAQDWIAGDPDPGTRKEMLALVRAADFEALEARLVGSLTFGTAGIRGEVGAGPNRMNRAVVIRTTSGLVDHLLRQGRGGGPVVVGFDARPTSRRFAEDTCGVLAAAGIPVLYFRGFTPTPLVAFAAKHLGATAAVVVTASHNPPGDNGYKVYSSNAAQIIPPEDAEIAAAIAASPPATQVPRVESVFSVEHEHVSEVQESILDCYWTEVNANRPEPVGSDLRIVYTPLHGVGGKTLQTVFARAGHTGLNLVSEQSEPDGTFPTVQFPNPEEKGSLDLAFRLATTIDAEVIIANDPDADRLAAVVSVGGRWRPLSGNEMGVLLGDYLLRNYSAGPPPIVINSVVSSPMLGELARMEGVRHETTLTGFKWIVNAGLALEEAGAGRFVFGYEEALGYTIGSTVRDKDGISAALVFCDLVAGLRARSETVLDRLAQLWAMTGVWASSQLSVVRPGSEGQVGIQEAVALLADRPPSHLGGYAITEVVDYRSGAEHRPCWLGSQALVELGLGNIGRILVRPSGTEPKLKIYVDLRAETGDDPHARQQSLTAEASALAETVASGLGL